MKRLTETERKTLERLAEGVGLKALSQHTGLSTHALKKGLAEEHDISDSQYQALVEYLSGHV